MSGPAASQHTNRLIHEKSPYLLQHAHNPVDWYPWGDEAFAAAKAQNKPLFISIGYSTCYWCHVMEKESFEDSTVAAAINAHFIPVKVDREERPDVDAVYMAGVQAMTGQGGWPMTVFATPEGKPFWGGTYFPPEDRNGRPGLMTILASIRDAWATRHDEVLKSSEALSEAIRAHGVGSGTAGGPAVMSDDAMRNAATALERTYDATYGGFGGAPKFPRPHTLGMLLRWWNRTHDEKALASVTHTLTQMARGGIHDQVGGGFHRYSTDRQWLVPHFEKMLYDQALLARVYCEAWQITGEARFADTARDICDYVLRDMRDAGGGLYAAEDAGEVGKEGEFYVWTPAELALAAAVPAADAEAFGRFYDVTAHGNFEHGASILHQVTTVPELAKALTRDPAQLAQALETTRGKVLAARDRRPRPHRDDKVLTDWNGLMIGALAYCGRALEEPRYVEAAQAAAEFALGHCQRDGVLLHRWRDGEAKVPGFLDDYAFLSAGLLDLYEATFDPRWLGESARLSRAMIDQFSDIARGGFYFTGSRNETLIARSKDLYDGALPSGNSVAVTTLVRLGLLTQDAAFRAAAQRSFAAFASTVHEMPSAFPQFLIGYDIAMGPSQEILLAGDPAAPVMRAMRRDVQRRFLPRAVLALAPGGAPGVALAKLAPFTAEQLPLKGAPTAYVCQNYACQLPTTTAAAFAAQLDGLR